MAVLTISGIATGLFPPAARATFHEWRIDEVYSNASGTEQFIEFQLPSVIFDDEMFVGGHTLTDAALGHSFTFPTDLPAVPQASQHFLVATPGFSALTGVPTPDYVLPTNNFFSIAGDTLTYASGIDSLTFSASQLPTDGLDSLNRAVGETSFQTERATPTNFAGVPEPGTCALAIGCGCLALLRRRRSALP